MSFWKYLKIILPFLFIRHRALLIVKIKIGIPFSVATVVCTSEGQGDRFRGWKSAHRVDYQRVIVHDTMVTSP